MTSAYILIAAVLLLGGILAALGDRLGSKVGKARLRLFNLRPRQTAVVVTVATGTAIAATTLGLLFATSKSLRQGIFVLDDILRDLRMAQAELASIREEKTNVEKALKSDQIKRAAVQNRLRRSDESFKEAQKQVKDISQQAATLRNEIKKLATERQKLVRQSQQLTEEIADFRTRLEQSDRELAQKDQDIAQKNQDLIGLRQERQRILDDNNAIQEELNSSQQKIDSSQQDIARLLQERQRILDDKNTIQQELVSSQQRLNSSQQEIAQRDKIIAELDQAIASRDDTLRERKIRLEELRAQIEISEENYLALRQGNVAIARGQTLAFGVVRIVDPQSASEAVEQLLRQANRNAIQITNPGNNGLGSERVVQIPQIQVDNIIETIQDGQDYVIRLVSAENYIQGEQQVQVFADIAINEEIFVSEEVVAKVPINPRTMSEQEIEKRLDLLLTQSQTRARGAGLLGKIQVEDGNIITLINFVEQLKEEDQPIEEIVAVASGLTYSSGPLILRLVALQDGKIIFASSDA
ncbi:MAG: DUF3084 domain-containing protein [Spirulinaceae cyanobacterium]